MLNSPFLLLWFCRISDYKTQLKSLGNDVTGNRGKMLHLILTLCQKVEKAFCKIVDGGEGGELQHCSSRPFVLHVMVPRWCSWVSARYLSYAAAWQVCSVPGGIESVIEQLCMRHEPPALRCSNWMRMRLYQLLKQTSKIAPYCGRW